MATDLSNDIAGWDDEDDANIDDWGDDGDITAIQLLVCGYSRAKQKENNLPIELMNSSINQIIAAFYSPLYFVATKRHPLTGKCSESALSTSSTNQKDLSNDKVIQLLICGYSRAKQKEYNLPVTIMNYSSINKIIATFYSPEYSVGTRGWTFVPTSEIDSKCAKTLYYQNIIMSKDQSHPFTGKSFEELRFEDQYYEKSAISAYNYNNQIDDSKEEEKRTEPPTNKVNVVIGFEQETFSNKMLSSKLDYFKARFSTNWNNTNDEWSLPLITIFGSNDECIFDLITFKLLLSNIDENGKFYIPSTLNPNQLMSLVECANYFAVLSNNDDLLKYYYDHCTKVITNQQLRQWIATKIKMLSVFASEHLKQRQIKRFQVITSALKRICQLQCAHRGRGGCSDGFHEDGPIYCTYEKMEVKQFRYILSLVNETDGLEFIDPIISQLHSFSKELISHECDCSHHARSNFEAVVLEWLLNICTDNTIRSEGYIKCVLLLMNVYVRHLRWDRQLKSIWTESVLNTWTTIVIQLMQRRYPNVMEAAVIPTWPYLATKPQLADRIFATVNNQQGHALALHILASNIGKYFNDAQQHEDFCSKYCN